MKKLVILLFVFLATEAVAQSTSTPVFICAECRDLREHPIDAANFALNSVFGPNVGAMIPEAWRGGFEVVDLQGNQVSVDVNASYDDGLLVPILWRRLLIFFPLPDVAFNMSGDLTIQAIVKDAYGKVLENIKLKFKEISFPLPVGLMTDGSTATSSSNIYGGGSGIPATQLDYWDAYRQENCRGDFSEPNETTTICKRIR